MTGISATIKSGETKKAVTVNKESEERDTNLKLVVDVMRFPGSIVEMI